MGRASRLFRRKANSVHDGNLSDVEFAELLDPIAPEHSQVEMATEPSADDVPVADAVPVADDLPVTSRFADTGIDDHRYARLFNDQADVDRVLDAEARADQRTQRHDGDAAGIFQLARVDRIVAAIDHHFETLGDEDFRGGERLLHIRIQRLLIGQHFQLRPGGQHPPEDQRAEPEEPDADGDEE